MSDLAILRLTGDEASDAKRVELAALLDARATALDRVTNMHLACEVAVREQERDPTGERTRLREALAVLADLDQRIDVLGADLKRLDAKASA